MPCQEQAPSVQRELISNFNPPAGTKNVALAMLGFRMFWCLRLGDGRFTQFGVSCFALMMVFHADDDDGHDDDDDDDDDDARNYLHFRMRSPKALECRGVGALRILGSGFRPHRRPRRTLAG